VGVPGGLGSTEPLATGVPVAAVDPVAGTEGLATGVPVPPTGRPPHALSIAATATQPSIELDVRTRDTFPTC
jgi:hypothetical protein